MAKGGHRRPTKRRKTAKKDTTNEARNLRLAKARERQSRKSKSLTRQMRGVRWSEEDSEEFEEELEDLQ
jgi:hypothetical protein